MLMVTATSTDGYSSTRQASNKSVVGITKPGECWAVECRRDKIPHLTIAWYFPTRGEAQRRAAEVNRGDGPGYVREWKDSGQRTYDARVVPARAYERRR
jgi:hypothetical protein